MATFLNRKLTLERLNGMLKNKRTNLFYEVYSKSDNLIIAAKSKTTK